MFFIQEFVFHLRKIFTVIEYVIVLPLSKTEMTLLHLVKPMKDSLLNLSGLTAPDLQGLLEQGQGVH